jgi:FkbM family methyltransferase
MLPDDIDRTVSLPRAEEAFARGLREHRGGRLAAAIVAYDEALAVAPGMAAALVNKGVALKGLGRLPEAMACYWQAIALAPGNLEAWNNAGNALAQAGRAKEALAVLRIALEKNPESAATWLIMGTVLMGRRHPQTAEACLRRAAALAPDDPIPRERLADLAAAPQTAVAPRPQLVEMAPPPPRPAGDIVVSAIFAAGGALPGTPRFRMTAPWSLLPDPGIHFLVQRERSGVGYEYATRCFLDAHLEAGDLFIDVGAHWGIMSLQAATRHPGRIAVLAIEPSPGNLPHLRRWIDDNGVANQVEVIGAAASDKPGRGDLKPESTMGHSLVTSARGPIPVVTIDGLLAERPHLADRRVIVKIDVEGFEPEVIQGMTSLLASGRVAAVIWERGIEYDRGPGPQRLKELRGRFDALGFSAWHFPSEDDAGALVPFRADGTAPWHGNVFELAAGLAPRPSYGLSRPAPMPQPNNTALDAALLARQAFQRGLAAQRRGKTAEALAHYSRAAAQDCETPGLCNNLGVLLRDLGRPAEAEAVYRRALATTPDDTSVLSNLGNVLIDQGRMADAEAVAAHALALRPGQASLLYNAGVVEKDDGRPERAVVLFSRALAVDPTNPDTLWDRALALLQMGRYAEGFPAYEARWGLKRAHKRKIPLPRWDGAPLQGRTIFLSDEQGFGDVLQFARFIPEVKRRGAGRIIVECQPQLMRLIGLIPVVDAVVAREKTVPEADVFVPLLSLPAIFATTLQTLPARVPYLTAPAPVRRLPDDGRRKVGLVWAGKPTPRDRSCPLELLLPRLGDPRTALYSLQVGPRAADLTTLGADALVTDLGPALHDFAETAAILTQLDLLITVDTAVAHLAGALGVPTFLLLRYTSDWRWFDRIATSPWYPSFRLFRQTTPNQWGEALDAMEQALAEVMNHPQD